MELADGDVARADDAVVVGEVKDRELVELGDHLEAAVSPGGLDVLAEGVAVAHATAAAAAGPCSRTSVDGACARRRPSNAAGRPFRSRRCDEGVGRRARLVGVLDEPEDALAVLLGDVGGVAAPPGPVLVPREGVREIDDGVAGEDAAAVVRIGAERDELHETWLYHTPSMPSFRIPKGAWTVVKEVARHLLRRPVVGIAAAARTQDGRWLLIRRGDTGEWALPGGTLEWGETLRDSIVREMEEEAGVTRCEIGRLVGVWSRPDRDPRFHGVTVVVACAVDEPVKPPVNPVEITEVKLFPTGELPRAARHGDAGHAPGRRRGGGARRGMRRGTTP